MVQYILFVIFAGNLTVVGKSPRIPNTVL